MTGLRVTEVPFVKYRTIELFTCQGTYGRFLDFDGRKTSFYLVADEKEVFLYVAKNFSKIHRENCHELAAYLVSCSRSRAYDMLRKQREELLEDVPNEPDAAPVPDDAAVSTDNIERLTELIGQMKPMYRDPLRLLAMGYTNREIAKSLGLTDEVVRTRLFRGRKLLWKEMNSHE